MRRVEMKRFIPILEYPEWTVFLDTQNKAVPYVLIDKQELLKKTPKTTQDLMNMHVSLFSSENLIQNFLNLKGEK